MKHFILSALIVLMAVPAIAASEKTADTSTRKERNYIVEGNKLYRAERYAEAEVAYRKALQENSGSDIGRFNLAASLLRQGTATGENEKEATTILNNLAREATDVNIAELAFFNLGNLAFNAKDYAKSIELYKNALRRNPDNDKARENLRLAQKRLEDQQNQNQNQNQQNQDQDKKDQDKQDQNKNQDQNKDRDKQDQDKQNQQQDKEQPRQQPQQQQGGISQENADKILKAMENEEQATRQRVEAERKKGTPPSRRVISNPW